MRKFNYLLLVIMISSLIFGCKPKGDKSAQNDSTDSTEVDNFTYITEQFADIKIMRYKVPAFDELSVDQKKLVYYLSQAALAYIFNISPSTVQKWERGNKRPTGASKKLLDIIERKGIEALL